MISPLKIGKGACLYANLLVDGRAGCTYVAEEDGSVVGFATWAEADGTVELEDLFVDPGYMRRGIATVLVGRIAEVLRAWACNACR